jgi:hypothetical protein
MNTSIRKPLYQTWYEGVALIAGLVPLGMFALDVPAIVLGVDRMNEIDRATPLTLWISVSSGLVAGGSLAWLVSSKSKREAKPLSPKQWFAIAAYAPISAFLVGWSINWLATILPGETSVVQGYVAESLRTSGRSLCSRYIRVLRLGHPDGDEICLSARLGRPVGPDDLSIDERVSLTIHITPFGSTVESIERD